MISGLLTLYESLGSMDIDMAWTVGNMSDTYPWIEKINFRVGYFCDMVGCFGDMAGTWLRLIWGENIWENEVSVEL